MACWNALSADQQRFLIVEGYLPYGYRPEGDACPNGAEVEITTMYDETPGPRFYCLPCAIGYVTERAKMRPSYDPALVPVDPWPEGYVIPEPPLCSGECLTATDIGLGEYGSQIAYPHPDCPRHGIGLTYPGDDYFKEEDRPCQS